MFTQILHPNNASELTFKIPDEFIAKDIKVMVFEVDENITNIEKERKIRTKQSLEFFKALPQIDMSSFKFNREEANER